MGRIRVVLALAVVASSVLTVGGAAADHGEAAISGTVTDEASLPLEGICVIAYEWDWEWDDYYYADEGQTAADGTYTLPLYPGEFIIEFSDCNDTGYIGEWYDDVRDAWEAEHILLGSQDHIEGIDATLSLGGSISGTVTDETTGEPISICVAVEQDDEPWHYASTFSDGDGTYTILGLPSGSYRVHFGSCGYEVPSPIFRPREASLSSPTISSHDSRWVNEWYDDQPSWEDADLVPVLAGVDTAGIDAQLVLGATISGVITEEDGTPIDLACVDVFDAGTGNWVAWGESWDGDYTVFGLRAGDYKVQFYDCWDGEYESEWFNDKRSYATADVVSVTLGENVGGIDAILAIAPMPDLAITSLEAKMVPLSAAGTDLPVSLGWEQDIAVEFSNLGNKRSDGGYASVWVEMRSDRALYSLGEVELGRLRPGESVSETFQWNAAGAIGDAIIHAQICSYDYERTYRNNYAAARTYALVGGTGLGLVVPVTRPGFVYGCWDYYEY
ncbi:MAG TPA: carboxypeptidase-like regulatory domain-containing protein [Actinomycetota bacterium]